MSVDEERNINKENNEWQVEDATTKHPLWQQIDAVSKINFFSYS